MENLKISNRPIVTQTNFYSKTKLVMKQTQQKYIFFIDPIQGATTKKRNGNIVIKIIQFSVEYEQNNCSHKLNKYSVSNKN